MFHCQGCNKKAYQNKKKMLFFLCFLTFLLFSFPYSELHAGYCMHAWLLYVPVMAHMEHAPIVTQTEAVPGEEEQSDCSQILQPAVFTVVQRAPSVFSTASTAPTQTLLSAFNIVTVIICWGDVSAERAQ